MTDTGELSREQQKVIGRLQLIGAISTFVVGISINILSRTTAIGLVTMTALVAILTLLISRVQQISFLTLIHRTNKNMVADLRSSLVEEGADTTEASRLVRGLVRRITVLPWGG